MKQKHYFILGIIAVLALVLINGCIQKQPIIKEDPGGKATSPVKIEMNMLQTPKLNDIVALQFKIRSNFPDKNPIQVDLRLPEGLDYVEGDFSLTDKSIIESQGTKEGLRWFGYISGSETIELSAKVKAVKSGDWLVGSSIGASVQDGQFAADDVLIVSFNETFGGILRDKDLLERGLVYDETEQRLKKWEGPMGTGGADSVQAGQQIG